MMKVLRIESGDHMPFSLQKQFREPKGLMGWIVGKIMEFDNRRINKWSIQRIPIRKGDHILEVGFGPGYCIDRIMKKHPGTAVDGVDLSPTMMDTANHKNKKAVDEGRVRLFVHDICEFQPDNVQYDHIFSVNNYPLWSDKQKALSHLFQMMKPEGTLLITVQPRGEEERDSRARNYADEISGELATAGFKNIDIQYKNVRPALTVSLSCTK
ncbi:class I SAM-dependent methyltransferase [Rossellomorea aquimaris]|uniref:class I SAM-dependent DNA methyltransferase n=1 Tax=Rossellomorea aquimaris TaxID=189382 RepID=UPI001CD44473|nr:class I SAM-dependent methyltransferase [Rossellomorea aquimaris]MCA1054462.1 class I SAM-dependent methyltransferase [Rossellomorea aquimaris]